MTLPVLVSADWLNEHLNNEKIVILDATIAKPQSAEDSSDQTIRIAGALFFDIDGAFSDQTVDLPHMICDPYQFENELRKLGIDRDSQIVVYDNYGIYSSPRAWWMLKSMGLKNVSVLNGGLPEWISKGFPTQSTEVNNDDRTGDLSVKYDSSCFCNAEMVFENMNNPDIAILDARSAGRFNGTEPEPRKGLRKGHIPDSINLPFTKVLDGYRMREAADLRSLFDDLNINNKKLIFSCGSGLTACIILLAAYIAGYRSLSVYDGSWSEWGRPSHLPVTTS